MTTNVTQTIERCTMFIHKRLNTICRPGSLYNFHRGYFYVYADGDTTGGVGERCRQFLCAIPACLALLGNEKWTDFSFNFVETVGALLTGASLLTLTALSSPRTDSRVPDCLPSPECFGFRAAGADE